MTHPLVRWSLGAALAACACVAQAQTTLRSADVHAADDYPTVAAVRHMGELLQKSSQGRFSIKVFNKGALGSEKETIDQAKIGALDLTRVNISPLNSICPATVVPTLPFLFRSTAHLRAVLDGSVGEEILRSCEKEGLIGLAFYDSGARSLYAKKPVRNPAEAKGLKLRVQQSDLWVALASAMGTNPTPMPYGEVFTALRTGLIDAAENNLPSYETSRHHEAVTVYSRTEHSMAPEVLLMSKRRWDRLSPADQQLVRAAAKASVVEQRRLWDAQEARSLAALQKAGVQFVQADKAAFQALMPPVYARFINTPELQRLVKVIQDTK